MPSLKNFRSYGYATARSGLPKAGTESTIALYVV